MSDDWIWSELPDGSRIGSTPHQESIITMTDGREVTISGPTSIYIWKDPPGADGANHEGDTT